MQSIFNNPQQPDTDWARCCTVILFTLMIVISGSGLGGPVCAQTENATLSGQVTDEKGGLLPGSLVEVRDKETNRLMTATTNRQGIYVISSLRPGRYSLSVQKEGFQSVVKDLELHVQDVIVINIVLPIRSPTASVSVKVEPRGINTTPGPGVVIERDLVGNLPLNGRSFQSLLELSPGAIPTAADSESPGQISINGQRSNANYFMVDGVSANVGVSASISPSQYASGSLPAVSSLGGTNVLVSIDALEEFRVQTSSYASEFGRVPGGQISIVTRSGGNAFHGVLFNYFRNDVLDANDWFANSRSQKKPALRQNDFGGVLGGPIRQNQTFFFGSYEGLRLRQPQTRLVSVPSMAARQNASEIIKPFLNAFPLPNGETQANGFAEFLGSYSDPSNLDAFSIRVDHNPSGNLSLFGRYSDSPSESKLRRSALSSITTSQFLTRSLTLAATLTLAQGFNAEFRANWSKSKGASFTEQDDFGGAVPLSESLLFPSPATRKDSFYVLILRGGTNSSVPVGENAHNVQRQINLVSNITILKSAHQLKFGIDYRRLSPTFRPRKYDQEITVNGVNGLLSREAAEVFIQAQYDAPTLLFTNLSAFAQDTWTRTPRMTLTYGLRWEHNPPPSEKNGQHPFTVNGLENPSSLTLASRGTPLWHHRYLDFAPRVGLAYQLSRKPGLETVVRGGIGIFYDLGNGLAANSAGFGIFPFSRVKFLSDVPFPLSPGLAEPPPFSLDPPFGFLFVYEPHHKLPRSYQWSTTLEQSLGSKHVLSASYVAAVGRDLLRQELLIAPNSNFDFVFVTRNAATSDYHALQLQLDRVLSKRLRVLAAYSWSHSIDTISNESSFFNVPAFLTNLNLDRASSDFDIRHTFTSAITYTFPVVERKAVLRHIIRNWSSDVLIRARSAVPVNIVTGSNFLFGFFDVRPDLNLGVPLYLKDSSVAGGRRINRAAFSIPPAGRQGNLGRNSLRGFNLFQIDLTLRRRFNLTERINVELKAEAFNLFNHPNFASPVNNLSNAFFGQSIQMLGKSLGSGGFAGGLNPLYQIGGARSLQLALKIHF